MRDDSLTQCFGAMSTAAATERFEVAVVGGGPVGLTAAIAVAQTGARTALIARRAPYADNRTTALLHASVNFLDNLGVWSLCRDRAAALRTMRFIDDSGRLVRSPEARFDCADIDLEAFGHNVENRDLVDALERRSQECPHLRRFDDDAVSVDVSEADATIHCATEAAVRTRLVIGADGRQSLCRSAARIGVKGRMLDQSALTLNISHARPHEGVSTEFHTANGPCVFVPLPGNRSSVVWVTRPDEALRLSELSDGDLADEVEKQAHFHLGRMSVASTRHVFPLAFEQADRIASNRTALVGDAAHVLPPIGAQGLNLGLRDAAEIAAIVGEAHLRGHDSGAEATLDEYRTRRQLDILVRVLAVEAANRTLLSNLLPMQVARTLILHALNEIAPFRRFALRQAIAPGSHSHGAS